MPHYASNRMEGTVVGGGGEGDPRQQGAEGEADPQHAAKVGSEGGSGAEQRPCTPQGEAPTRYDVLPAFSSKEFFSTFSSCSCSCDPSSSSFTGKQNGSLGAERVELGAARTCCAVIHPSNEICARPYACSTFMRVLLRVVCTRQPAG